MIASYSELKVVFGDPKPRRTHIQALVVTVVGWEDEHERSDSCCGCEVEPAITGVAFDGGQINLAVTGIPYVHGHPLHVLFPPLVEA